MNHAHRTARFPLSLSCLALAITALVSFPSQAQDAAPEAKPAFVHKVKPGDIPPEVLGLSRRGDEVKTTDFKGKVLVTTFWATWCAPCRAEMSALEKIQRVAKEKLQVVAVNIEDRETYRRASRDLFDWQMMIINDQYKRHADSFGVGGIPHMFIIGRDGKVQTVHRGYSEAFLKTLIEDVIKAIEQ